MNQGQAPRVQGHSTELAPERIQPTSGLFTGVPACGHSGFTLSKFLLHQIDLVAFHGDVMEPVRGVKYNATVDHLKGRADPLRHALVPLAFHPVYHNQTLGAIDPLLFSRSCGVGSMPAVGAEGRGSYAGIVLALFAVYHRRPFVITDWSVVGEMLVVRAKNE